MPGLVVGHHALLVLGDHAPRLHAGDHTLERRLEVLGADGVAVVAAGEDRGLVADVGQVGAGEVARLAGDQLEVDALVERLVPGVHVEDRAPSLEVGRAHEDLAVEAARAQQRRIELLEQVGGGDHDHVVGGAEAVELHQQLVERLVLLARDVLAARGADGVELVDEDDRRRLAARVPEQPADAGGAQARRTSRRTRTPTGRRTWPRPRSPPPWRAGSCRCRVGRAAGSPSAPSRRACGSALGRAGTQPPRAARPWPRRRRPRPASAPRSTTAA